MKTVNDFIKELSRLREDLKELPCVVRAENGMLFEASIKQLYEEYQNPLLDDKPKHMIITYD